MKGTKIGRLGPEAQRLIAKGKRKGEDQATTLDRRIVELQKPSENYQPHPRFMEALKSAVKEAISEAK